ncbi:MAG: DNA-processing protein DprA [Gammaproteobacteria bacterium]|nr:DNA-processing protein DprA [Gammaproteobacteria bacterium]
MREEEPARTSAAPPSEEQVAAACLLTRMDRRRAFAAIAASGSAVAALTGPVEKAARRHHEYQPDELLELCERHGLAVLTYFDHAFPPALRHIPDPPLVLYLRGERECLVEQTVAVVGARRCSRMGAELAQSLGAGLAGGGLTVVSGLARGIDAAAHRGALTAAGSMGSTAAVMGAGLASIYPRANTQLAEAMVEAGGVLVSEYPPTMAPARHQFPERNRLISGLSKGVVVVEAGERSGSLITARLALEQGREVMAVPGAIGPGLSRGCHRLLRDGAALVESVADVFVTLGYIMQPGADDGLEPRTVPASLGAVLAAIEPVLTTVDELVASTGLAPADVAVKLLELELAGFVQQVAEGYIRRPF